jgi:hypothetical protein
MHEFNNSYMGIQYFRNLLDLKGCYAKKQCIELQGLKTGFRPRASHLSLL